MDLARRGEIDPWDIDIALATEKFLQYIDSLERRDLRIPARTLLYASILLRLKSEQMEGQEEEEEIEPEEIEEAAPQREEVLDQLPRPPLRRHTKRPVTLDELISELKKAEVVGRRKAMRERWPLLAEKKILDPSHEEGIEERIKALGPILDEMFTEKNILTFQEINIRDGAAQEGVTNYISLLFMAQRRTVWLEQEEIFGDLFVRRQARADDLAG